MTRYRVGGTSGLLALNAVLAMCVIGLSAVVVHTRLRNQAPAAARPWLHPRVVSGVRTVGLRGHLLGRGTEPRRITEFADYQCPFCRAAAVELTRLQRAYPGRVAIAFRNLPLDELHPRARSAARAAECAADQGRFAAFHDTVFLSQTDLAWRPWSSFAAAAGIRDTSVFAACMASAGVDARVHADEASAERLQLRGTPTFVVGDSIFEGLPPVSQLESWFRGSP